jgi:hypothetical protein
MGAAGAKSSNCITLDGQRTQPDTVPQDHRPVPVRYAGLFEKRGWPCCLAVEFIHSLELTLMTRNQAIILCGALALMVVTAAMVIPRFTGSLRGLFTPKSYDWVSRTMATCEEDAVTQPATVNFLVMPLERTRRFGSQLESRALETLGRITLFGSQDALDGLKSGALRISSRNFVLHTFDTSNNVAHRWNSASGVSRLTTSDIASDGPFKVRIQTTPNDPSTEWSKVTADGRGTCHWVFALLRD